MRRLLASTAVVVVIATVAAGAAQAASPGAPTGVSATPGDTKATVKWHAAAANGSTITAYDVTASGGGAHTCSTAGRSRVSSPA